MKKYILGIDASNLSSGGGLTHLIEFLNRPEILSRFFSTIQVWSSKETISKLPQHDCIQYHSPASLNGTILSRSYWYIFKSKSDFLDCSIDLLFNPGGAYIGQFRPFVSMSRNMLVFDHNERNRYGFSKIYLRLKLLEYVQSYSFSKAKSVIFISNYARQVITQRLKISNYKVIHHGVSTKFETTQKLSSPKLRITYISQIDVYKHQLQVIEAFHLLNKQYPDTELHLYGYGYPSYLKKVSSMLSEINNSNIYYHGGMSYNGIQSAYQNSDLFIFASTCENMPNILIEAMQSGLPIACSKYPPMPEFLEEAGLYFDPLDINSIYRTLEEYLLNPELRLKMSELSKTKAQNFHWDKCVQQTCEFLYEQI